MFNDLFILIIYYKKIEKQTGNEYLIIIFFTFLCSMDVETGECVVQACGSCSVPNHETVVRQSIAIPTLSSDVILVPNEPALSAIRRV